MKSSACRPSWMPPIPTSGNSVAAATSAVRASATGRTAGPERPPLSGTQPWLSRDRVDSHRAQRVDQGERIRPAILRGPRDRPDLRDVGRQLHDQRLRGQRADPAHERRSSPPPRCPPCIPTSRSGRRRSAPAPPPRRGRRPPPPGSRTRRARTPPRSRSGAPGGWPAPAGRARGTPSRPLFGRPIELISPDGVSHSRGGGLPPRGASVIVFDTKAEKGKRSRSSSPKVRSAAIASNVPDPFRTGWSSSTPARSIRRSTPGGAVAPAVNATPPPAPRPSRQARPRTAAGIRCGSRTTQPKQAPKPHAMPASRASCASTPRATQIRLTASSIGCGPHA